MGAECWAATLRAWARCSGANWGWWLGLGSGMGRARAPAGAASVSLDERGVSLEAVLKERSGEGRPQVVASRETRWDQVSLRVRDRPVERIRAELAALLNDTWERREGRPLTLTQDAL